MLRRWICQADITVHLEPQDPILVKSGYAALSDADSVPVETYRKNEQGVIESCYYLPGSSLKGALRSHFERIARSLQPESVCIPYYDHARKDKFVVPVASEAQSYGCGYRGHKEDSTAQHYASHCPACRLFGSLKFTGRFSIGDAYPLPGASHTPKKEHRHGVGIDRFTGGSVPGVLFDQDVLVGGTFAASIRVINFELWQLAAVGVLLQDLEDELVYIGSGQSRGLGRVKGSVPSYVLSYIQPQDYLVGLGELARPEEQKAYVLHRWQPPRPLALPDATTRGLRHQYDVSDSWRQLADALAPSLQDHLETCGGPRGAVPSNRS